MQMFLRVLVVFLLASSAVANAQEKSPYTDHSRFIFSKMKIVLLDAAQKMPEEHYGFKPAPEVRSFGQLVGHIADSQYAFCSMVLGEKNPRPKIEENKKTKAELTAALADALAYCDKAYNGVNDATAAEMVKLMGYDMPKLGVLTVNHVHYGLHYGNMVTYLRMKGIVPPTSDPDFKAKH